MATDSLCRATRNSHNCQLQFLIHCEWGTVLCRISIGDRRKPTPEFKAPKPLISPGSVFAAIATIEKNISPCRVADRPLKRVRNSGNDGGLLFAADPRQSFDTQTIFWAPEVLPTVLSVGSVRSSAAALRYDFDLSRLSATDLRRAADGWHAVLRLGGATHRLWLREFPSAGSAIAVELPLDSDFDIRSQTARRLWSTLNRRPAGLAFHELSLQRRHRLALTLRALDGRIEGNSYRAIAEGLFGPRRIPDRAWKTHDLRNRTIRLVQSGLALMRGGYRELLRQVRRRK